MNKIGSNFYAFLNVFLQISYQAAAIFPRNCKKHHRKYIFRTFCDVFIISILQLRVSDRGCLPKTVPENPVIRPGHQR